MAFDAHKNFAYSTVATAPSPASSGTSLTVQAGDGAAFPAASFNATVWPLGTQPSVANAEIVRVTVVSTDTFTITRTQEGSSARSIAVGDQIAATITAKTLTDVETSVLDYVEITSNVTVTATTDATATAVIDGAAVTYDGSTRVLIELYAGAQIGPLNECVFVLYDGATDLGRLSFAGNPDSTSTTDFWIPGARVLTPSAGSHTYHIKAWKVGGGTAVTVYAGLGGAGVTFPAWYRITKS